MQWLSRCCHSPIFKHKCVVAKVVLRQPNNLSTSCCYVATSERRRIHSRADYCCIALREASIRRSQRSNSEAVLFRGTLPRRYSIRRSRWDNTSTATCHTTLSHYLNPTTIVPSFGRIVKFPYLLAPKLKASLLWYMLSTVLFCAAYVW